MENLQQKAKELIESGTCDLIIGFEKSTNGKARPVFVRKPEHTSKLIFNESCDQNIAVYLYRQEVKHNKKKAIVANHSTIKSIVELAAENQVHDGDFLILAFSTEGNIIELKSFDELEKHVNTLYHGLTEEETAMMKKIEEMSLEERWAFWENEFSKCIKCYACRASCPMCYCPTCTVEINQPQWISVPAHTLGNLEWHIMRAMHLAGRCITCGQCGKACPLELPIHLLTYKVALDSKQYFNSVAGTSVCADNALAVFKTDDHETFIR
ncbi:MAG: 4Fe-4S dicluster domain-containing protein [Bacteroidota bacterium]